jgi:glycosyltransferase involved in cell wall biosynthesis
MRVLHIATFDRGGAGRSALRLHESLLACGQESSLLLCKKAEESDRVHCMASDVAALATRQSILFDEFQIWYINENRTELSNTYFSLNEQGIDISAHPWVQQADIINLHWVAGFLSPSSIASLQRLGKPIVWTIHDQRPFTGGCHFSAGCEKFKTDCSGCPQLDVNPFDLSRIQLADMIQTIQPREIMLVSPSKWLAELAGQSALFRESRIEVIPYSLDVQMFKPADKIAARQALGLATDRQYALLAADNVGEKRKGFKELCQAMVEARKNPDFGKLVAQEKFAVLCLGLPKAELSDLGVPVETLGYVTDNEKVIWAYNAADFMVLPSLEDNLPNTVMEAMSCERPVAAFPSGGIPELIEDGVTGRLAKRVAALGMAIAELATNPDLRARLAQQARARVLRDFQLKRQGEDYLKLYKELSSKASPSAVSKEGIALAPASIGMVEVLEQSLPRAVQDRLYKLVTLNTALEEKDKAYSATIHQQNDYIKELKALADSKDQELKALLAQRPVKLLRKLGVV